MISVKDLIQQGDLIEVDIGNRIWNIERRRRSNNITMDQLAKLAGISLEEATQVMHLNYASIDEKMIAKLEKALGLELE